VIVGYVVLYLRLTRTHERAEALLHELEAAHAALANYAARVEELTLANERQRLARELHDTLAQGLAGLTMQLDAVDALLSEENLQEAQEIVQQAMGRSRATLADARKAIDDLRSVGSDALNCSEAVQEEILHFTTMTGIACHADLTALAAVAPPFHGHVLSVITEGLLNVARHGQAHQVWVRAIREDGTLIIEIRDDGIGFDTSREATRTGHYGLLGLRERARLIGGRLEVESARDMGTTIRFSLPSPEGEGDLTASRQEGNTVRA
jgi:NarL family two-component system sensor histidine kinase YdfH